VGTITVGIDLGGTKIQAAAVREGKVAGTARVETPQTDAQDVVTAIASLVVAALTDAGADVGDLAAIGIGTPGEVDTEIGRVSRAANVRGFEQPVLLGPLVSAHFAGARVTVDNDVRVATVGEFQRGAGRPYHNLLGVFIGTGVGGGLILEGRLRRGRGSAGEIGHTIVRPAGRRCRCGRQGCLEAYAGRQSIEETARRREAAGHKTDLFDIMRKRGRDRVTSSVIEKALEHKDSLTVDLINEAVDALGIALANAQNLLDLEAIIVGGGLGDRLGRPFVDRIGIAMTPNLFVRDRPPALLTTELQDLSGAVGAAVIAGG
jgi:glucokinase